MQPHNVDQRKDAQASSVLHLLPDSEINWLQSLGQRWRSEYWRIGDDINLTVTTIMRGNLNIPIMSVYQSFVDLTGGEKSERTMRYLAQVAKHYSGEKYVLRAIYKEVPHYFFGIIMRYPGYEEVLLELTQGEIDLRGRCPGESWLYMLISKIVLAPTIDSTPIELPALDNVPESQPEPQWQDLPAAKAKPFVGSFLNSLHDLGVKLKIWDLPAKRKMKITKLLEALQRELQELEQ